MSESTARFTQVGVSRLRIPKKPNRYRKIANIKKGLGLMLLVSHSGSKTWHALHYVGGKPRTSRLGEFPEISVSTAYDLACKFEPADSSKAETGTFQEVAENFVTNYVGGLESKGGVPLRSKAEIERCLNKYVYPEWGSRQLVEIRRSDVMALRDRIGKRGARQANMVLAILSKLMNWYALRSEDYQSPIVRGMAFKTESRDRVLNDDELRAVWNACEGTFGDFVKLLLLTAQRREKVGSMKWAELELPIWNLPREPREKSNPGSLTLPPLAVEIIEARDEVADNPYVFPGRVRGQALNSFSQGKAELDQRLPDMPHWTLHDLRRTARSLMARAGVTPHIAERVLGHTIKGVEGIYDRHAYEAEKAHALESLAGLVERIVNPPKGKNVVPIRA